MSGGWLVLAGVAAAAVALALFARRFTEIDAVRPAPPPLPPPRSPGRADGTDAEPAGEWPHGAPGGAGPAGDEWEMPFPGEIDRVPVTHPMLRRAAENALERGGRMARSFVREGEMIYATFAGIEDPGERAAAADILLRLQSGGDVGMDEVMWLLRRLG